VYKPVEGVADGELVLSTITNSLLSQIIESPSSIDASQSCCTLIAAYEPNWLLVCVEHGVCSANWMV
jgi:hypothetical protein